MPSIDAHARMDEILFGRSFRHVHAAIDAPTKDLGLWHRLVYHSPLDVLFSSPENRPVVFAHHMEDLFLSPIMVILERNKVDREMAQQFMLASKPSNALRGFEEWFGKFGIK